MSEKSDSSIGPGSRQKDGESSLERIHTFNLKAPESNKSSLLSPNGSIPSSPSSSNADDLPTRKFKNLSSLLSLKAAH